MTTPLSLGAILARATASHHDNHGSKNFHHGTMDHGATISPPATISSRNHGGREVFELVRTHPALVFAQRRWGMSSRLLYRLIEERGLSTVLDAIQFTKSSPTAKIPGAYCTAIIRKGGAI